MHDFLERFLEVVDLFVGCGADNAGRVAGSDRIVGNVMRDHAAGADDAAAAYLDARTDDHAAAQPADARPSEVVRRDLSGSVVPGESARGREKRS